MSETVATLDSEPLLEQWFGPEPVLAEILHEHRSSRWRRVVARWKWKHPIMWNGSPVIVDARVPPSEGFGFADDPRYRIDF